MDKVKPFVDHEAAAALAAKGTVGKKLGAVVPMRRRRNSRTMDDGDADLGPEWATLMLLHEPATDPDSRRAWLTETWIRAYVPPWKVPIHKIRDYLGDLFGFYFLFLSVLAKWCLYVGVMGVAVFVAAATAPEARGGGVTQSPRRQLPSVVFAPVLVLWGGAFFADFKRQQASYAKEWGSYAWAVARPKTRPAFVGIPQTDLVYGKIVIDWPDSRRRKAVFLTWLVVAALLLLAVLVIAAITNFKQSYGRERYLGGFVSGTDLATVASIAQVQVLNGLYKDVARTMTRRENWKTDAQYADHLTSKLVLFKLCNTFASIVFVAFLDAFNAHGCGALRHGGGCLHETYLAIWPLFLSGAAASFLGQFLAPWVQHRRVVAKTRGVYGGDDDEDPLRVVARRQFVETAEYDNIEDTIDDYLELAVQFGYVAGFGAAFPLAPLLCFFLNTVQLKQDGYKLLWFHRRPLPLEVRSIGVWEKIFGLILKASIFSNCGIVVFTAEVTHRLSPQARFACFAFGVLVLWSALALVDLAYPPLSEAVVLQLVRQDAYVRQVIFDVTPEVLFDESADVAPVDAVSQDIARKDHNDDLSYLRLTAQLPTSAIRVKVEREMMRAPEDDVEAAL